MKPPAATSCSSPTANPDRQPTSGPRLSPRSTVRISGMSGASAPIRSAGATLVWARPPPSSMRARDTRTALGSRLEQLEGEVGQQVRPGLSREEEHLLHPGEVGHGVEPRVMKEGRALVLDGDHAADGQSLGEDPADPGGHDEVADLDAPPPPAQPALGDDGGREPHDPVVAAPVPRDRPDPAAPLLGDDLARQRREGQAIPEGEETAQPEVFPLDILHLEGLDTETLQLIP